MINASSVALEFHSALPVMARPETTEGYQGFYHLCQMYGDVTDAKLGYILRCLLYTSKAMRMGRPAAVESRAVMELMIGVRLFDVIILS